MRNHTKTRKEQDKLLDGLIRLIRKLPSHVSREMYKEIELIHKDMQRLKQENIALQEIVDKMIVR